MKSVLLIDFLAISVPIGGVAHEGENRGGESAKSGGEGRVQAERSTWQVIQEDILNVHCVSCHSAGSSFARQSDLVLTADVAYEQLVDVVPRKGAAGEDGLVRVSSTGGFAGVARSFLWEKINAAEQEHFYEDHPYYGAFMPLGQEALTKGKLAFIQAWIEAGAPREGAVADAALLEDVTHYEALEFAPLQEPENGIQLHVGPFDVWSEIDREFLYFQPYVTTEDLFISGYEISMREGSHHFLVKNYPADVEAPEPRAFRDYRDQRGKVDLRVIAESNVLVNFLLGTQTPYANFRFPPGIALRLPAGTGFDLNSHYVRGGEEDIGEVYANIYTVDSLQVRHVAEQANFSNFNIELPPNEVTTLSQTFAFGQTRHVVQMWSHAHEKMVEFTIEIAGGERDGELIYWTNDWQHPPLLQFDPPLTMQQGEGWKLTTTYNNWTDEPMYFGLLSTDEMQFVFYVYYPDEPPKVPGPTLPQTTALAQNYPNPFNSGTAIPFALAQNARVHLAVYNLAGQQVATLAQGEWIAGIHKVAWNGRDSRGEALASGVYLYRLRAGDRLQSRKLLLLR